MRLDEMFDDILLEVIKPTGYMTNVDALCELRAHAIAVTENAVHVDRHAEAKAKARALQWVVELSVTDPEARVSKGGTGRMTRNPRSHAG